MKAADLDQTLRTDMGTGETPDSMSPKRTFMQILSWSCGLGALDWHLASISNSFFGSSCTREAGRLKMAFPRAPVLRVLGVVSTISCTHETSGGGHGGGRHAAPALPGSQRCVALAAWGSQDMGGVAVPS